MVFLKLALVATSVLLASLAARRFGHALGGTLAGLPMIAGPIIGFVLWQEPLSQARAIALATLVCLPAAMLHMACFAWAGTRWRWPGALALANIAFMLAGSLLSVLPLPPAAVMLLALLAPSLGLIALPRLRIAPSAVGIPHLELALRVLAAVTMAWIIMRGAGVLPAAASGLLLALPIAGNVLPCFTLPRYGAAATVALIAGFMRGVYGFAAFFVVLYLLSAVLPVAQAYVLAWIAALATALTAYCAEQRMRPRLLSS
jgi:hypothetical protein